MKRLHWKTWLLVLIVGVMICGQAPAQFIDDFSGPLKKDPAGATGWAFFAGEGKATIDFRQGDGYASILVDATKDKRNVWWALIKRKVSDALDLSRLREPGYELRIQARIRVSEAPRRVNLHLNTQKTTDFHSHLMEFDIADSENWHTISMTTRDFEAEPGDTVNGQLALMDWGLGRYQVDLDDFRVDVVNAALAGPDQGEQVPYHPPLPDPKTFAHVVAVAADGMVDLEYPEVNFNQWYVQDAGKKTRVLTAAGTQLIILRWDLSSFAGKKAAGGGLLEVATHSVERTADDLPDFGLIRVVEILGGNPNWEKKSVTFNSLCRGHPPDRVLNPQMIIDWPVTEGKAGKTFLTISRPVLQRLIDGRTLGIAIRPLGTITASFYSAETEGGKFSAKLLFNIQE